MCPKRAFGTLLFSSLSLLRTSSTFVVRLVNSILANVVSSYSVRLCIRRSRSSSLSSNCRTSVVREEEKKKRDQDSRERENVQRDLLLFLLLNPPSPKSRRLFSMRVRASAATCSAAPSASLRPTAAHDTRPPTTTPTATTTKAGESSR